MLEMRPAQPVLGQLLRPPLPWTTFMEARLGELLWMGSGGLWVLWVAGVLALCENPEADVTSLGRVALKRRTAAGHLPWGPQVLTGVD